MRSFVRELIGTLVIAIAIFLLLRLVVGSYTVVSPSMEPGVQAGERLIINKLAYRFSQPARGDIVFYKSSEGDQDQLKRVIGLPGDVVEVKDGVVYLNSLKLTEPYIGNPASYNVDKFQIPPERFFILGDNRQNSHDSSTGWTVPLGNILGKAWISIWPPGQRGGVGHFDLSAQLSASGSTFK
jgi:signal peptidase I